MTAEKPTSQPVEEVWTVKRILDWTTDYLARQGSAAPRLDSEILLAHARQCQRIELYTQYESRLTDGERAIMRDLVQRRAKAEPVAYLVGFREFFSLAFEVTPDVLIPRPETEMLVVNVLERAKGQTGLNVLDLGTGSGCIAVSIAANHPNMNVVAVDISPRALDVARRNSERHGVDDRIQFLEGDLFEPLTSKRTFDFIVSNPPYVAEGDLGTLPEDVRLHEPHSALLAGGKGLDVLQRLIHQAPGFLNPSGWLLVEIASEQAQDVVSEFAATGFSGVECEKDLSGQIRCVRGRKT